MSELELIVFWICCWVGSIMLGIAKDRVASGFVLGLLFGLLGVLVMVGMPESDRMQSEREARLHMRLVGLLRSQEGGGAEGDAFSRGALIGPSRMAGLLPERQQTVIWPWLLMAVIIAAIAVLIWFLVIRGRS